MNPNPGFPLHRLNQVEVQLWLAVKLARIQAAKRLVKDRYPGGFGVVAPTGFLFAVVDPRGNIRELLPPLRRYELHQMENKPKGATVGCQCGEFFHPEVKGPFKEKAKPGEHHPLCQFDRTSKRVFERARGTAANRLGMRFEGGIPIVDGDERKASPVKLPKAQARPDEWDKIREEERGR